MDRNQATGLILIALMVILYFQFFAPEVPQPEEQQNTETKTEQAATTEISPKDSPETQPQLSDSLLDAELRNKYGLFAIGAQGEENILTVENEDLIVVFSSHGAKADQVTLKKFKNNKGELLDIISKSSNQFKLVATATGREIDLYDLYYSPKKTVENDTTIVTFTLNLSGNQSIVHRYEIPATGYQINYDIQLNGLENVITKEDLIYQWNDNMIAQEKDLDMSRRNSTINYYLANEDFDYLTEASNNLEEAVIDQQVKWVSLKQRFFVAGFIADNAFNKGRFSTAVPASDTVVKEAKVTLGLSVADLSANKGGFKYYFGPNDYYLLGEVADEFNRNLSLGWPPMKWVNRFVIIPLFEFLSRFIGNYGLIIIIMVLIIKLALSPLSYKSYVSMAKMKVLKPELDEIKERNGDDMAKAQQEQMKLYQKVGVNPISGCIPMLLQMPILLAMFYFFPQSIELRQEAFLWAEDLSTYDSIINLPFEIPFYGAHVSLFVLLMAASQIAMTYSQQQVSTVQGPMKALSYMMPIIFIFVLNSYPAALSFYYFISNLVTFGQQMVIRKLIDEDKIKTILEENKKKNANKKKSKFQQRLEDAMKAQEQKKKK